MDATKCLHSIGNLLRLFESLRSSFGSFGDDLFWPTLSKQLTRSLDALLLLLPFKWQTMLLALLTPPPTVFVVLLLLPFAVALVVVPFSLVPFPVACSMWEISSTCSLLIGDPLLIFLPWSLPNGDGISCFNTVKADDNDKNESLKKTKRRGRNALIFGHCEGNFLKNELKFRNEKETRKKLCSKKTYLFKYELLVKSPFKSKSISSVQPSRAEKKKKEKDRERNRGATTGKTEKRERY